MFTNHIIKYDLDFGFDQYQNRLLIFAETDDKIYTHNMGISSYKLGHNAFSHLTFQEFQQRRGFGSRELFLHPDDNNVSKEETKSLRGSDSKSGNPSSVDWEAEGKVTPVGDEGNCGGACWAFAVAGALEGGYAIKTNQNVTNWNGFSEQMLVSCDTENLGCNGGYIDTTFTWVKNNNGLCSEDDYPYENSASTTSCKSSSCTNVPGSTPLSTINVYPRTDNTLETAVALQPVAAAVEALSNPAWQSYSSGVLTGTCGTSLDHAVLVVGYGIWEDGTPYWKVKNDFGVSWGMDGYILIEKDKAQYGGQCGIDLDASYPSF